MRWGESPSHEGKAFALVVPALCNDDDACCSAADSEEQVEAAVIEAISMDPFALALLGQHRDLPSVIRHWALALVIADRSQKRPRPTNGESKWVAI